MQKKKIEQNNRMGKTRDLFKNKLDNKGNYKQGEKTAFGMGENNSK